MITADGGVSRGGAATGVLSSSQAEAGLVGSSPTSRQSSSASQLSADNFADGAEDAGPGDAIIAGGYGLLIDLLASKVKAANILLSNTVKSVEYSAAARTVKVGLFDLLSRACV